jgi:DNA segregation ATPase FtsK/SpoIIIE, S-DNA-T family
VSSTEVPAVAKPPSTPAKAAAKPTTKVPLSPKTLHRLKESALLLLLPVMLYLLFALVSYQPSDPSWSHEASSTAVKNLGGRAGAYLSDLLYYLFGYMAYLVPIAIGFNMWRLAKKPIVSEPTARLNSAQMAPESSPMEPIIRGIGVFLLLLCGCLLFALRGGGADLPAGSGGLLGGLLYRGVVPSLGSGPVSMFSVMLTLAAISMATGLSWFKAMDWIGNAVSTFVAWLKTRRKRVADWQVAQVAIDKRAENRKVETKRQADKPAPRIEPVEPAPTLEKSERATREVQMQLFQTIPAGDLPPLSLLDEAKVQSKGYSPEELTQLSRLVEIKLKEFRIDAQVINVYPGPVITRFELQPAAGIRASQISNLDRDIARGLSKTSVRVVEVIAGTTYVGLEIPNVNREMVFLSEILASVAYDKMSSPLALALGKDIGGKPVVVDIQRMPHLLVAGTTGSGKSVALNAMILSLLYKATASDVRMIMIDPKMLELSVYDGIPHLLTPVVTDMKEAANALRWCVVEMERRYKLMAACGVRNLGGFNRKVKEAVENGQPISDPLFNPNRAAAGERPPNLETLPYIVVVIDEFADMMMIVGKKVEELIARLAQKARAAGIHLILATQRPSVDVITGLIKANIPTRIAFQVSSKIDSRTILDQSGAETLLGHGDMLYLPPGSPSPERVHGAFCDDHEVHHVVAYLKQHYGEPKYINGLLDDVQDLGDGRIINESGLPESSGSESDVLYDQAVRIVTESRKASISSVQRRLKIGYNRAARLIEEMEAAGVVSGPNHQGNREVIAPPPPGGDY